MQVVYNISLVLAILIALFFVALIVFTGKGDAMGGGGGSVRTSFHGKASFEDYLSRMTFGLGAGFIVLMIILNFVGSRIS